MEGWKEGGGRGGVSGTHWGSVLHIIVIWSFPSRKKEEGCEVVFFSHSLVQLSCGFAELPFADLCTHIRYRRPLICLARLTETCTPVVIPINASLPMATAKGGCLQCL